MTEKPFSHRRLLQVLFAAFIVFWIVAAVNPVDRSDWLIENLLVFALIPLVIFTYRPLPLSDATYTLLFLFLLLHTTGAHYRYADVPVGYWLQDTLQLTRNPFDRIVHLAFGLLLTYPAYEIILRTVRLRGFWAVVLPPVVIVSLSGFFEIIESIVAGMVEPELGAAYLGIQGDVWDAQKDMALAIVGSMIPAIVVARVKPAWRGRDGR